MIAGNTISGRTHPPPHPGLLSFVAKCTFRSEIGGLFEPKSVSGSTRGHLGICPCLEVQQSTLLKWLSRIEFDCFLSFLKTLLQRTSTLCSYGWSNGYFFGKSVSVPTGIHLLLHWNPLFSWILYFIGRMYWKNTEFLVAFWARWESLQNLRQYRFREAKRRAFWWGT